jgi:Replicative DNA helicase
VNNQIFYNDEYEKIILNMMLIDNSVIDVISTQITDDCFYSALNREFYTAIKSDYMNNGVSNLITLQTRLPDVLPANIAALTNHIASSENWSFYVDELQKLYKTRSMKQLLLQSNEDLSPDTVNDVIANVDSSLTKCLTVGSNNATCVKELCSKLLEGVKAAAENKEPYLGYSTGWDKLSEILDGIQLGKQIIIGARPSIGKSSFALQLAGALAEQKIPVGYFSLEMQEMTLMKRLTSLKSGLTIGSISHGTCVRSQNQLVKLQVAVSKIYEMPLYIHDESLRNEKDLLSRIRYMAKINGVKVFFVDHIGLVKHSMPSMKRVEQLDDITQQLLHLAQELNIAIILLCQLRRDAEGKEPALNDLRDSGSIEQNADVCIFLHHERSKGEEEFLEAKVIVAKNRDGACGSSNMNFYPKLTKFVEVA